MASELREARRAAGRGRIDEALVYLWNAVEPARLDGDEAALAGIARLAREIQGEGDPGQQREATRLLAAVEPPPSRESPSLVVPSRLEPAAGVEDAEEPMVVLEEIAWTPEDAEGTVPAGEPTGEEPARRRSRAGLVVPLLLALVVIVNILARVLGDR